MSSSTWPIATLLSPSIILFEYRTDELLESAGLDPVSTDPSRMRSGSVPFVSDGEAVPVSR